MNPKLIGNPLVAWRDDACLQIGWGEAALVVEAAPHALPEWLRSMAGQYSRKQALEQALKLGLTPHEAARLLDQLQTAGLLEDPSPLKVAVCGQGAVLESLGDALRLAGVQVVSRADVVVFAQGQLPTLVAAPTARRLIPVWSSTRAVHVGPVIDEDAGPCPRCVDLTWTDHDPSWPRLVAQAATVGLWGHPCQMVQAAGAIALLGQSPESVGLEMIQDSANPGPCWRVWTPHPGCGCQRT
jgi:hypothetical protein